MMNTSGIRGVIALLFAYFVLLGIVLRQLLMPWGDNREMHHVFLDPDFYLQNSTGWTCYPPGFFAF